MKQLSILLLLFLVTACLFADGTNTHVGAPLVDALPYTDTGDLVDNTNDNNDRYRDEWWEITPVIDLTNVDIHPVYDGWDGYLFVYDANLVQLAFDDDGPGGTADSQIIMDMTAGETYYIVVDEYSSATGNRTFTLNISSPDYSGPISDADAPGQCENPFPAVNAINVPLDATLTWDFGANTETYDLFFDSVYPPVNQVVTGGTAGATGSYTPTGMQNASYYYWKVVSHNSITTTATSTSFYFQTDLGANIVQIGSGVDTNLHLPIEPYNHYTYSQTIYLQSEINMVSQRIEKVYYHYTGGGSLANSTDWTIWMGHTTASNFMFGNGWESQSSLTQVYDGMITPTMGEGWIEIVLQTPFVYNNSDNLVIAILEDAPDRATTNEDFYCETVATTRSLSYYDNTTVPDPLNPSDGELLMSIPETRLFFDALPTTPELSYNPSTWDFGTLFCDTASTPLPCTAQNTGTGTLNIQSVVLDDEVNFSLVDNNTYPMALNSAESMNFDVVFNPIDEGDLTGTVTITDDTRQTYTMTFTGHGFQATVSTYPYAQTFDDATLPIEWTIDPVVAGDSWEVANSDIGGHGADTDATGNFGYWMVVDDSSPETVPAHLYSPPFDMTALTNPLLTFNYWIGDNANTSTLNIDVIVDGVTTTDVAVVQEPNGSTAWTYTEVSLAAYAGQTIMLDFRAMESDSFYGDICIDDVAIFDNSMPPAATTLIAPTDAEAGVPMTGTLSWLLAQGASGYYVSLGTDNPPTDVHNMADAGNSLTFDYASLAAGTTYYWQVVPYNPNGSAPNCPVWSFTTFNDIPNPATLVSPDIGATYQNIYPTLVWADGGNFPDGYKINLGTDNPPTDVYQNHDVGFVTTFVSDIELAPQTTYYWQVVPYNFVGDAQNCPVWNFITAPDGLVVVGGGTEINHHLPIEPYYGYSYSQSIYLQSDLNVQGQQIESILYYYNGGATLNNSYDWVIYMGHTTESQINGTDGWIPIDQLTEVFNATIPPATGEGWIEFMLDTPFIYNNTDNLVVAVEENMPAYGSSSEEFLGTITQTPRSIYYYSDSTDPDPTAPPSGTVMSHIPNTMFYFDDLPTGPELLYRPLAHDFGTVFTNTQTPPVTFTLQNAGIGTLVLNSVTLSDGTDFVLTDTNTYPVNLNTAESTTIEVVYAPVTEGPVSITIDVDTSEGLESIPLSGTGFNSTISVFPYVENFDTLALPIGWEQGTEDQYDWSFGTSTPSTNTGPQAGDHTSGTGGFAFTEASGQLNSRFDLISPPIDVSSLSNPFSTIWYHMLGESMGTLHFDIWDGTQWNEDAYPEITGDQGDAWSFVDISLGGYGNIVQVRFRGITGDNYYSDISIDDFGVWDNDSPPAPTTLVMPADGATGIAMTGTVSWDPALASSGYYVSIGTDNPPTDIVDMVDVGNALSYDYSGLQPGVVYNWMVTPYNAIGVATNCPVWSFTTFNDLPNPATVVYPADGALNSYVSMDLEWASGGNFPDGYRVYLGTDNPPTNVLDGVDAGFNTTFTIPAPLEYSMQYYWQVVPYNFVGDATGNAIWTFTTHPAGMVILGDGTVEGQHLPIEPYYGYSYSQSIHTLQEIGTPGFITSVSYYYNGAGTLNNSTDWVIYLGLTTQNEFVDGTSWIPLTDLTEVWNAPITPPTGAGWIDFPLAEENWFLYDGSQNLVIAVEENMAAYGSGSEEFLCTATTDNRSIYYYSDSTNPDPATPPSGNPLAYIPNTRLFTLPTGDNPYPIITPSSLNFGFIDVGGTSDTRTITIRNVGQDSLYIDVNIAIQGDDAAEFILSDNNTYPVQINYLETVDIDITFMPTTEGYKTADIVIIDNAPDNRNGRMPRQVHNLPISGRGYFLDNNDTPQTATQLALNVADYEEMIYPETEVDWYSFWITAPADLTTFTEAINGSQLDTYMCLYGPYDSPDHNVDDQMYIMADDDGNNNSQPRIEMPLNESGFYYIRLSQFQNVPAGMRPFKKRTFEENLRNTTGEYSLTIHSSNPVPPEDYYPPENLMAESLFNGVELTWDAPTVPVRTLDGYNVYRDDVMLNAETIHSTIYIDYDAVVGNTYEYKVSTVYNNPPGESAPCDSINYTHVAVDAPIISESFETYDDFATDIYPWFNMDMDGEGTYGFNNGIDFPGENDPMSYIVFNPNSTVPPLMLADAYNGDKYAACFAADSGSNDDWLITPHLDLGDNATELSFWARSYTTQYGPEQLRVCISTTGNDPAEFTPIVTDEIHDVPLDWTYYSYDLTDYAGQLIYIGFNCVSSQTFFMMLDNIVVNSDGGTVGNEHPEVVPNSNELFSNYPNPFNPTTTIKFNVKENDKVNVSVYNIRGQKVTTLTNDYYSAGTHSIVWNGTDRNNKQVSSGIYFFKMQAGTYTKTKKMILMK